MHDTTTLSAEMDDDAAEKGKGTAPDPHDFGATEQALNDAAKRVNAVWISFVLLCVYIFIATYTVTPAVLFRDAPVKLPIFNADLPLKVYFLLAPFLVLSLHAYLIILTKGLAEKIDTYEYVLTRSSNMSARIATGRRVLHSRLDTSIIIRAMSARYRDTRGFVDMASGVIAGLTMVVLPVALLLLTQLIFLPYQEQWLTWAHRGLLILDVAMCLWLLWPFPLTRQSVVAGRLLVVTLVLFATVTSIFFATFPGEWAYAVLYEHWPHAFTAKVFEGPPDPVDYIHKGGILPFPNRLILPDDPKLNGIAGASVDAVSLSVRGRNFRKAIFDRSNLTGVDFSAVDLTGASLQGAKLEGAKFKCTTPATVINQSASMAPEGYAEYADWQKFMASAELGYTEYQEYTDCTRLRGANLSHAVLNRSSFNGAQLSGVDMRSASLEGASFNFAEMSGADLREAVVKSADFSNAMLFGASFTFAQGSDTNFTYARLTAADFSRADLFASVFYRAMLQGARFAGAQLSAAQFNNSHMQGADLSYARLSAASFIGVYLQDATLDFANIKGTSFVSASLRGVSLKCVTPFRTNFTDADLLGTVVKVVNCTTTYYPDYSSTFYPADKYDLEADHVGRQYDYSYDYSQPLSKIYDSPEKLSNNEFERQLNDVVLSNLPEEAKSRVRIAFERLKPVSRTKEQDEAEKTFWVDWAKRFAMPENLAETRAMRLEFIACVAQGAPYIARGLIRAGRFDQLDDKEQNEVRKKKVIARLKAASDGSDPNCLGAKGLQEYDFPSTRSP